MPLAQLLDSKLGLLTNYGNIGNQGDVGLAGGV